MKYEYGGKYLLHDMSGILNVKRDGEVVGRLKVHDIFNPLPRFMKDADCIFCDPPCSKGNLNTFYNKAEKTERHDSYMPFFNRYMDCLSEVSPDTVFMEVFASNKDDSIERLQSMFRNVHIHDTFYYNRKSNRCWILEATDKSEATDLPYVDETPMVMEIAKRGGFSTFGDLCMGQGLVGRASWEAGKHFVGTELNLKRLAVLADYLTSNGAVIENTESEE